LRANQLSTEAGEIREACFNPTAFFFLGELLARHHYSTPGKLSVELCNRVDLKGDSSPLTEIWALEIFADRVRVLSISWLKIYGTLCSNTMGTCIVFHSILNAYPKKTEP
jgi:hypothetical protein